MFVKSSSRVCLLALFCLLTILANAKIKQLCKQQSLVIVLPDSIPRVKSSADSGPLLNSALMTSCLAGGT